MKYSLYILYFLVLALTVIIMYPMIAQAKVVPVVKTVQVSVLKYSKEDIQQAVSSACGKYSKCDKGIALAIVEAETGHYTKFIGDQGTSIGIAQIHLPAHPEVTRKQAEDIYFSANFLAQNLAEGHCRMWSTCPLAKT